jgi:beta-phosphoglucomutase-like phosphatase (HAD superfamily)
MKAIIFDMDGVLVDTMPFHYEAMKAAVKGPTDIELDKRTFYLLEGMPINEMAHKILKLKGYDARRRYYSTKNWDKKETNLFRADETDSRIIPKC